jgi:glycosyltransferase involved in cell wall biosynthesis
MKLSIVIPAYNEEKYLPKCLESVAAQLGKTAHKNDIEVIVVNNASTDKTKEIAQSFAGVMVVDEINKGLVRARKAGFMASTGDVIANVDSDCILPNKWINKVFEEFEKDPNLVALSGPYRYMGLSSFESLVVRIYYRVGYIFHVLNQLFIGRAAVLQGGNFVVRREALKKIGGYDTTIEFYGEDTDIARRIQKIGRVKFRFDFFMYTSSRRLKKEGLVLAGIKYVLNFFWTTIFGKPISKEYQDIR